jgi:hypothetical protein
LRANAGIARLGVGLQKKIDRKNSKPRALARPATAGLAEEPRRLEAVVTPIRIAINLAQQDGRRWVEFPCNTSQNYVVSPNILNGVGYYSFVGINCNNFLLQNICTAITDF